MSAEEFFMAATGSLGLDDLFGLFEGGDATETETVTITKEDGSTEEVQRVCRIVLVPMLNGNVIVPTPVRLCDDIPN